MKIIKYKFLSAEINHGTEETPNIEQIILEKSMKCPTQAAYDANYPIAEKEAIHGTIEVSGAFEYPIAPLNIYEGEYVMIGDVLYLATMNIPCGEPVIVGQNAVETTIEEQLYMLKGE